MDWQPIQTAPKDGRPLLLHYQSLGVVYGIYDHEGTADWWVIRPKDEKWWSPYMDREEDPLRWQAIPAAPPDDNISILKPITRQRR